MKPSPGVSDRQIVPEWMRDRNQVQSAAGDWWSHWFRVIGFHTVRAPLYVLRLAALSPYGVFRFLRWWARWISDASYEDDRSALRANGGDVSELNRIHRSNISRRSLISFGVFILLAATFFIIRSLVHPLILILTLFVGLCVIGLLGRPDSSKTVVKRTGYPSHQAPPFTERLMLEALRQAGAEPMDVRPIQVLQPPTRIRSGWEAIVSTGVESSTIIERRSKFATAIDRPENCVWLSADPEETSGWLRIVVTRKSLRRSRLPEWPLLREGAFNWFKDEVPIGVDEMGNPVAANKAYRSTAYGGNIGSGKTVSLFNSVLAQAVDPRVEVHIYDLEGGTDWLPFGPIAHFLRSGSDHDDHQAVIADLEDLNERIDQRYKTLRELPDNLKSLKTNDLLAGIRDLDLHPVVVVIDETQELFEFANDADRYINLVTRILKKGRTVGITIEIATQEVRPKTISIAEFCHWRQCFNVADQTAVDLVLGAGASRSGFDADALTPEDVGIGYFGSGKNVSVVKSYYIDHDNGELGNVIGRLTLERSNLGLLTGMAAGNISSDENYESTLERVIRIWPEEVSSMQWVELIDLLHQSMPEDYPEITDLNDGVPSSVARSVEALSTQLRRHGVTSQEIQSNFFPPHGQSYSVRQGIEKSDVQDAIASRTQSGNDATTDELFIDEPDIDLSDANIDLSNEETAEANDNETTLGKPT